MLEAAVVRHSDGRDFTDVESRHWPWLAPTGGQSLTGQQLVEKNTKIIDMAKQFY
jgi:hypothetical protein